MIPSITNSEASLLNPLGAKLSSIRGRELGLLCRIDSIGSEMQKNVGIVAEIIEAKLDVIRELLSLSPEKRDFTIAESQFVAQLDRIFKENVECYQNLLGARDSYMQSGTRVLLTPEKKQELVLSFENTIKDELKKTHLNIDASTNLELLEKSTKGELENQLSFYTSLLDNKTLLGMEFEKTYVEKNKAKSQIDEIKSQLYSMEATNIWQASERGDLEFLKKEIKAWWPWQIRDFVNQKNKEGQTMLALSSAHGRLEYVNFLLSKNADPNIPDNQGYCPLHWAAKKGFTEIGALISSKANVNALGEYQRTPLNMAAFDGQAAMCTLLLSKGADINARTNVDGGGSTALHVAIMREHTLVVEALIKNARLDVNILDSSNHSPLYYAIIAGCPVIAAFVVSHTSWKSSKYPNDPNHMSQLAKLTPNKDAEGIKRFFSLYL